MKNVIRDCAACRDNLRAYLDSELSANEREAMNAHIANCPDCAEELNRMTQILTLCAELNEGLIVPASASDAWRQAVRAQMRRKRKPLLGGFAKTVSVLAAALLVLVIGTQMLQQGLLTDPSADQSALGGVMNAYDYGGAVDENASAPKMARGEITPISLSFDDSGNGGSLSTGTAGATTPPTRAADVMLMRSASRTIESAEYDATIRQITDIVKEYGRFERQELNEPNRDAMRSAYMLVRVPSADMDDFLKELEVAGRIVARSESNEDISGRYTDTQTRLTSLQAQVTRLNEMLGDAQTVEDMILIDDKVRDLLSEIDSMQRILGGWDDQVKYARITLFVNEVTERELVETETQPLEERVRQNFWDSVEWLELFLKDALVVLARFAPQLVIWVPALILVLIIIRVIVKKSRR